MTYFGLKIVQCSVTSILNLLLSVWTNINHSSHYASRKMVQRETPTNDFRSVNTTDYSLHRSSTVSTMAVMTQASSAVEDSARSNSSSRQQ